VRSRLAGFSLLCVVAAAGSIAVLALASPAVGDSGASAVVTPATGLHDGQIVSVTGTGFPPLTRIQIIECAGTAAQPPKNSQFCQGDTLNSSALTDENGAFKNSLTDPTHVSHGYRIYVLPHTVFSPYPPDCGPHTSPCGLYVGVTSNDFTQPHVFLPISFAGSSGGAAGSLWPWIIVVLALVLIGGVLVWRRRSAQSASG
jgi:hypothetical protein